MSSPTFSALIQHSLHRRLYLSPDQHLRSTVQLHFFLAGSKDRVLVHLQIFNSQHARGLGSQQRMRATTIQGMNSRVRTRDRSRRRWRHGGHIRTMTAG